jgi:peptidoglycan/LPS O-acetylase OafA/YrhL
MSSSSFQSGTIARDRFLPGIHGLRGLAALAIVLFHMVHLAKVAVPVPFSFIPRDFGKGVHLFFVLSAFSLLHSTEHTMGNPSWVKEYFVKRFFRIAPLYYCVMAGMMLWPLVIWQKWVTDFNKLVLNLTFTFGLAPWTGMVWAGWSVGVEMLFYAILPLLMLLIRTRTATLILVVISIFVSYSSGSALQAHYEHTVGVYRFNWAYFSFPTNLCYFAIGMYAYRMSQKLGEAKQTLCWIISVLIPLLFGVLLVFRNLYASRTGTIVWGVAFGALSLWQSKWPSRWSANRFLEHVGERSYSVYLLHPVLIMLLKSPIQALYKAVSPILDTYAYFVCVACFVPLLLIVSEFTYRLIEVPGIRYGRKMNALMRAKTDRLSQEAFKSKGLKGIV